MSKKTATPATAITRADLRGGAVALPGTGAGFQDAAGFSLPEGAIVKSMSPMIRPNEFPVGKVLVGRFAKIFETSPDKKKKGVGVEIVPDKAQIGVALPAVATIARGLEINDVSLGEKATSPHLGKMVAIQKFPDKLKSKKGQDAWNFVVAILPEPAK